MSEAAVALTGGDAGGGGDTGGWTAPDWATGLEAEYLPTVQSKGWKTPADAVRAYHGAQKLVGADPSTMITLPKDGDTVALDAFYAKLGRPADAKDYTIEMPAEGGDEKLAGWLRTTLHKLGASNTLAKGLSGEWNKFMAEAAAAGDTDAQAKAAVDKAELLKIWGPEGSEPFKASVATARQAAEQFGISKEQVGALENVMGFKSTMTLLHSIGSKLGEPGFTGGGEGGGGFNAMTPVRALQEIDALNADPEHRKAWADNRNPGHKAAMEKMQRLFGIAYPGDAS